MKKRLAGEQVALSQYLETLLNDESSRRTGAMARPVGPFECLAFHVRGLMFAILRADSSGVMTDPSSLRHVDRKNPDLRAHDEPWRLGAFRYRDSEVMAVDIAGIVIPPDVRAELADPSSAPVAVILVEEGHIGIVCDSVPVAITVAPDEVCWPTALNSRPWLAGMILKRCALLDVPALCAGFISTRSQGNSIRSGG